MRFTYEYRTSDNALHKGVIDASDRDAVYVALRARGIKPSRVDEAPGLFNKLFGKGKRWMAIVALSLALAAALAAYVKISRQPRSPFPVPSSLNPSDTTRRQIIGDAAIIDKGIRTGWSDVFPDEGERFLSSFAVPGVPAGLRNTSEAEIRAALDRRILPSADDTLEARQIKAMVEGMKAELREYLADGGTIVQYGQAIVARQEEELGYYNRAKAELEAAAQGDMPDDDLEALWEQRNASLRRMGIRLIPMPE